MFPQATGFPKNDLFILNIKVIKPSTADDSWSCDLTVKNNNATLGADNITFNHAESENSDFDGSVAIKPGKIRVIRVYSEDNNSKTFCTSVTIYDAGVVGKNN